MLFDKSHMLVNTAMTCSARHQIHRLMSIIFINHLILLAGISRTAPALENWGKAFEERIGLLGANGWEPGKWARYLKGVLPTKKLRTALIEEFPGLEEVLRNPLWKVLRALGRWGDYGESLIKRLTVDGKPLHGKHRTRLQRRMSTADWQDLVFLLVILADEPDDLNKYRWARKFVEERFYGFLYLVCAQRELIGAEQLLYQVLNEFFDKKRVIAVPGWPVSAEQFEIDVRRLRRFPRWLMQRFHLEGELSVNFLFSDPEGFEAVQWGYAVYWDADWRRRVLTSKENRYLYPPLHLSLKGMQSSRKRAHGNIGQSTAAR